MTYTPNIQFAPFYMSVYADGTQLRHHGAQEGQFEALLAGTEHLVVAGGDEAAVAASNGSDLVIVGGYYQRYPACLIVPQDSPITALNQLAGRTIGVPGRTGETWYALQLALETAGLTESDVTIQEIGFTQQAALVGGKVDAVVGFSNNDAVQIAHNGVAVRRRPMLARAHRAADENDWEHPARPLATFRPWPTTSPRTPDMILLPPRTAPNPARSKARESNILSSQRPPPNQRPWPDPSAADASARHPFYYPA